MHWLAGCCCHCCSLATPRRRQDVVLLCDQLTPQLCLWPACCMLSDHCARSMHIVKAGMRQDGCGCLRPERVRPVLAAAPRAETACRQQRHAAGPRRVRTGEWRSTCNQASERVAALPALIMHSIRTACADSKAIETVRTDNSVLCCLAALKAPWCMRSTGPLVSQHDILELIVVVQVAARLLHDLVGQPQPLFGGAMCEVQSDRNEQPTRS